MSKYTTEVRFICETYAGYDESQGYADVGTVIENSREKVFDFDFPIFDESYRSVLETKLLKHYYTREIGFETVGLWKLWLNKRLNEIMPFYNQLYKSETLEFNPFYDVDFYTKKDNTGKYDETSSNTGSSKSIRTDNLSEVTNSETNTTTNATRTDDLEHSDNTTTSTTHYDLYSDTPQGALNGVDNENYLTNARKITDNGRENNNGTNTGTVKNTGTQKIIATGNTANTGTQEVNENTAGNATKNYTNVDDYLEHVAGKRNYTTYSAMLKEYRETFLNIDMMIIGELSDLFMNVW